MKWRPSWPGSGALLLGAVLVACEIMGVASYMLDHHAPAYQLWGSCLAAMLAPMAPVLASGLVRAKERGAALACYVLFVLALLVVVYCAVDRAGGAVDGAVQDRARAIEARGIAVKALTDAQTAYDAAQAAAVAECKTVDTKSARGPRCDRAEARADLKSAELERARTKVEKLPTEQSDAAVRRFAQVFHITEDTVRVYQPLSLPLLLSFGSWVAFALWHRSDWSRDTIPYQDKSPPVPLTLAQFLFEGTLKAPGEEIELEGTLYEAFRKACLAVSTIPPSKGAFGAELGRISKATGLQIEMRKGKAYLLSRKLAA